MRNMYYVDMHCHPSIKPYSWYISKRSNLWDCRNVRKSLWYDDPPNESDRAINRHIGLTKFTQSDFRTLTKGDVKIVSACLSPIERHLFIAKGPFKKFGLRVLKFSLELNTEFIELIRKRNRDYFNELLREYFYYLLEYRKQRNRTFPTQFELIRNFSEIEPFRSNVVKDTIYVFFSIEGSHVFNNGGLESKIEDEGEVKRRIRRLKRWSYQPLYVSLAHHIYNDLCGHAKSLPTCLGKIVGQTDGMGEGFTSMGRTVRDELLSTDNGRRIYIDIKHMSAKSRIEYYRRLEEIREDENNDENQEERKPIPVLASHGAVNGRRSIEEWDEIESNNEGDVECINEDGDRFQNEDKLKFNNENINFFDDEIIAIQKTQGFLGIQLDERRLCSAEQLKCEKKIERNRGEKLYYQAGLVWKQIRYVAEVLDKKEKFGWGTATIGSDYDGSVDPPNGYWTSADFGILEENLIHHAVEYFKNHLARQNGENQLPGFLTVQEKAREVIDLFMRRNALRFLKDFL